MKKTQSTENIAKYIAEKLLEVEAIKLSPDQPFKWSSGWNSPIYCDNRVTLSYPDLRSNIKNALADLIKDEFPQAQAISGVATAGIAQGALVAEALDLPFSYVRAKAKGHGMENLIEGRVLPGQKVVLVEDLISTGGSSLKAAEALGAAGVEVLGLVAIFTYGFQLATDNFREAGIPLFTLSDYNTMLDSGLASGVIKKTQLASLQDWRKAPEKWGISS